MDQEINLKYREVTVPSASVKTIVATDYEIVEAPGAGKTHVILAAHLTLDYATATYVWANTDHTLTVGNAAFDSDAEAQAFIEGTSRKVVDLRVPGGSTPLTENEAIKLTAGGTGEPGTGDSDVIVRVVYATIDVTE
jgi:hypothetical protein